MKKILIVDDQPEVRRLVDVTLRFDEYHILQAENGEQGVAMALEHKPDLIIMDVMMPGKIDGLEATRRIKGNPETSGCTVIMLTAKGQQVDQDAGRKAGAEDYFIKPFSPLDLIRRVEDALS